MGSKNFFTYELIGLDGKIGSHEIRRKKTFSFVLRALPPVWIGVVENVY